MYITDIRLRRPKKKTVAIPQQFTSEDADRLYTKFRLFTKNLGLSISPQAPEHSDLKRDLAFIFDPEMLFEALVTDFGSGYILGVLVTYRALRDQGILDESFEATNEELAP